MARWRTFRALVVATAVVATLVTGVGAPPLAGAQAAGGDEDVFAFGDATFHGSTGGLTLARPIVGMAATPTGNGYWLTASDGGIFAFGDARFHGSTGAIRLNRPVVGMAATPTGNGYWLTASDGGIFAFGDARFHGSTGAIRLNQPIVGMAATPTGRGYWLTASDGGVFTFGDARFHGSGAGAASGYRRIAGIAARPQGGGYWLVATTGCRFTGGTVDRTFLPESDVMLLTDIRTGRHACYERVVFDFRREGGGPGTISYDIGYRRPPFAGPSGQPIPVDGNAFLQVAFRPARGHTGPTAEPTYTGPFEIRPRGLASVREIQRIEDFEATLVWVIGLDQRRQFNVVQLDDPDRVAIDIGPAAPPAGTETAARVFFTPTPVEQDCGAVRAVSRTVAGPGVLREAMNQLLAGPTAAERAAGLTSWFSPATAGTLNAVTVSNRTARIDFDDFSGIIPNASTACGSATLLAQLNATATQFPTVDRAVYSFNGDVAAFYAWLQLSPPR
jgi:hypothetical protein